MALFQVLLLLTTVLLQFIPANGQDAEFYDLSTSRADVQRDIVNEHNEKRRTVSPPASNMLKMSWSSEAAENAQNWANKCLQTHSVEKDREISTSHCGENLFMSSYPRSWSEAIQSWYNEVHDFVYDKGPRYPNAAIGHYTQIAWYSSYLVGCGVAYCPNHPTLKYYYVCQYCPSGNIRSRINTPYQQGTPCASCPNDCDNGLCTNSCQYVDEYSNCKELVSMVGCNHQATKGSCKATCLCQNKIY
ncbi:PREDICTED: cysteine-rich secretory protein 3 [Condylura cristata]|uniref:cysteine-rich secretory protein 3 n=1 Tax=Condylura cristata TaxID=143302 RepID=UPI0003345699|nr:PREDICTED: cysteine-rich secretory protein 3 [Condylura cristata]